MVSNVFLFFSESGWESMEQTHDLLEVLEQVYALILRCIWAHILDTRELRRDSSSAVSYTGFALLTVAQNRVFITLVFFSLKSQGKMFIRPH